MSTAYWRVNSLAIVGAAIALISVFLPWWGIYELVGSSVMLFAHWTLWSPPGSAVLRKLGRPRFPINSKHLSDIHHFKPHSADSSPGRGITRPCWRPHSRPEILGSRTGSVNLNTNRLHRHNSLRDIQPLPIVPSIRIRTHRYRSSLRNHVHLGIRDWILHLHRWNSHLRPVPRLEQQPGQNHCDPSRRSLRPNQPTDRLKPRSSFLNHWRVREDYSLLGYLVEISTGRYGVPTNP